MPRNRITVHVRQKPDRDNLQLYYVDPLTGDDVTKSAGTDNPREAEKAAARWEEELGNGILSDVVSWDVFRQRFEDEHLPGLARKSAISYGTALNAFERLMGCPRWLEEVTAGVISQWQSKLLSEKFPATTVASYQRHVLAALRWAESVGILQRAPKVKSPRTGKRMAIMRGRPLTDDEFARMLAAVPVVRPVDAADWEFFLRGLWWSGLRLGEALRLFWDRDADFSVDLDRQFPAYRILAEGQKARRDEFSPVAPEFVGLLTDHVPSDKRSGRVFHLRPERGGGLLTDPKVGGVVAEIGRAAGVVTDQAKGKHATAHDFRRSFGTRWARRVLPVVLQRLMRHESLQTTMAYYVGFECDDLAADVWKAVQGAGNSTSPLGQTADVDRGTGPGIVPMRRRA